MLRRSGGPDILRLEDLPEPEAAPGQVVVRVERIGINYAEVLSRKGLYSWSPRRPYVPGMEATGIVEAVGEGVDAERVGERVMCGMQHGAYAERVAVPGNRALPALAHLTPEENAAFAVNFMTAWVALVEMARIRSDDRVAVSAAAGGVGTAAVMIAAATGCDVTALAGADEKLRTAEALGAARGVNYRTDDFEHRLTDALGDQGFDVVLELVGGRVFRACMESLSPFGRLVVAGYASLDYTLWNPLSWWRAWRDAPRMDVSSAAEASVGVLATHIGYLLPDEDRLQRVWTGLTDFATEHELRPVVGATYPFDELPEAHRFMESRRSVGKILVEV